MQTSLATMEERDRMDTLDSVRDSQLSFTLNLRAIAAAHAAAVHRLLRLLVCLIAYSINIHTYFNGSCMRKFQKEKNHYKNNRGSFWELENRIMGRKKRIMCGCLPSSSRSLRSPSFQDLNLLSRQAT